MSRIFSSAEPDPQLTWTAMMKKIRSVLVLLALFAAPAAIWGGTAVCVTARTGNGSVDWAQLGPPGTLVPTSFSATGTPPTVSVNGTLFDGLTGTAAIERKVAGPGSFLGDFTMNDRLLLAIAGVRLQFLDHNGCALKAGGVSQVGSQIQPGSNGYKQATIVAYDNLLGYIGSCSIIVINNQLENNSAPYLGISDTSGPNIAFVDFIMDGFAINKLSYTTGPTSTTCAPLLTTRWSPGTHSTNNPVRGLHPTSRWGISVLGIPRTTRRNQFVELSMRP